ncbi:TetR/AcrR family transcriptional regulator [Planomicrobium sp. YIM 101495]|uniref:TetR/AcrR family transcriptional regulator n=1 Tax=Planomicrobium sp. YIM 101495 TaxID=2665160 RepID=UPI0012B8A744|nr:TetR/AcrR family transcriptional regulator [Planomicrobium sp. YIM 101495]MTD30701.1 TetR family transcriptional regulator [Planomicrobium sp. YIM 101495]
MKDVGLRDQKKLATRRSLAEAAFELAVERGVDGFVVEDVARKAGYSRRTFANYFSCKEEAIANSFALDNFRRWEDRGDFSPEHHTPLSTIELFIRRSFSINKLIRLNRLISLSREHPALRLHVTGVLRDVQDFARLGIREEFGSAYPEEYYHVLIGAVFGAILPVLDESIEVRLPSGNEPDGADNAFDDYMAIVFAQLRKGFN